MRVSEPVHDESTSSDGQSDIEDAPSSSGRDTTHEDDTGSSSNAEEAQGSHIPFEQLLQQKQEGGLLPKGSAAQRHSRSHSYSILAKRDFKRENKNRPIEQSSKRPVPRHRQVVELRNSESRDPRFENLSGKFSTDQFRKQYAFVYDEELPEEKRNLKSQMQKTKDPEAKQQLQTQLARIEQQIKEEQTRRQQQTALKSHKAEERAAVKQGKKPFFLKRSEAKRQELVAKYKHLKASGGLEKVVQKRRRKNAMKDHRYVPSSRNQQ
ncbi:hypothetical protein WJX79_007607 [Trebouxia sp. C0005]|nr:MAG: ribosomal RNA processing 36 protein [Trebouxia sp. A1-2]